MVMMDLTSGLLYIDATEVENGFVYFVIPLTTKNLMIMLLI